MIKYVFKYNFFSNTLPTTDNNEIGLKLEISDLYPVLKINKCSKSTHFKEVLKKKWSNTFFLHKAQINLHDTLWDQNTLNTPAQRYRVYSTEYTISRILHSHWDYYNVIVVSDSHLLRNKIWAQVKISSRWCIF